MIPRFQPRLSWREFVAAARPSRQDDIFEFERAFADATGQKHAITFPYGRTALMALLQTLGFKNEAIICPAYTCVVVPHAIVLSGNRPVFVDAGADANMALNRVSQAIESSGARAVVATSLFGHPVDLDALEDLRRQHPDLFILQDCAHSFAVHWQGRPVHRSGDAALYGLNISKIMTSIFGGMLTTDDSKLADSLHAWRDAHVEPALLATALRRACYLIAATAAFQPSFYGVVNYLARSGVLSRFTDYYDENEIDFPTDAFVGMTALQARVGRLQAQSLAAFQEARIQYGWAYRDALSDLPSIAFPPVQQGCSFSHVVGLVKDREDVMRRARRRGIELGHVVEYSVPEMGAYRAYCKGQEFPVAAYLSQHVINLPVSNAFSRARVDRVASVMRAVLTDQTEPAIPEELRC